MPWVSRRTSDLALILLAVIVILSGCTGPEPAAVCQESPRIAPDDALQGVAQNGELWALGDQPQVGKEFKLVIRVTGSGTLAVSAVDPDGARHDVLRIDEHVGSNFSRPGDEWGLFFEFDQAGCWEIVVSRGELSGLITLAVDA